MIDLISMIDLILYKQPKPTKPKKDMLIDDLISRKNILGISWFFILKQYYLP